MKTGILRESGPRTGNEPRSAFDGGGTPLLRARSENLTPIHRLRRFKGSGLRASLALGLIAAWLEHPVALLEDGSVVAWGSRCHAHLRDGERDSNRWSVLPVLVKGPGGEDALAGVVSLSGGAHHTIALLEDGTADAGE